MTGRRRRPVSRVKAALASARASKAAHAVKTAGKLPLTSSILPTSTRMSKLPTKQNVLTTPEAVPIRSAGKSEADAVNVGLHESEEADTESDPSVAAQARGFVARGAESRPIKSEMSAAVAQTMAAESKAKR